MNGNPHVHSAEITRHLPYSWKGSWYVAYGDTKVRFAWPWQRPETWSDDLFERETSKALHKAIRKHDQGSIREARKFALRHYVLSLPTLDRGRWGSEQLKELEKSA